MIFSFSLIFLPAKRYFSSSRDSITFRCSVASIHRTNKYPAVNWLRARPEPNKLATHFLQQYAQMARWPHAALAQNGSRQREPNDETVRVFIFTRRNVHQIHEHYIFFHSTQLCDNSSSQVDYISAPRQPKALCSKCSRHECIA